MAWQTVLATRADEPAVLDPAGRTLRTFAGVERERVGWRDALSWLAPGSVVIGGVGQHPSWPALLLACLDLRLILAPVDADLPAEQLARVRDTVRAGALARGPDAVERWEAKPPAWAGPFPDLLKVTSGTTGTPRVVRCRERHLVADCRNICRTMGIGPTDVNFGAIAFAHSYGFSNLVTPLLWQGTAFVCAPERLPRPLREGLARSGSTVFPGTPALFGALAELPGNEGLGKIRLCLSAGALLPSEVQRRFREKYGLGIHSFYGSSECGGIAYDRSGQGGAPTGFVGQPMEGVEVGHLPDGRIEVKGDNVADGYHPVPDPETLDGVRFLPGDLVERLPDGLLLRGRVSDFVNVAGRKLHPSVIEEHLRRFPGVVDAVAFGVPSPSRNEELIAYVVTGPGVTRTDLEAHCRAGLGDWQVPRDLRLVPELPVNERGKLSRAELAKRYADERSAARQTPASRRQSAGHG